MNDDVHSFVAYKGLRCIPNALIFATLTPRVLHQVVLGTLLIYGLTINEHTVVVGGLPIVVGLLALLLGAPFLGLGFGGEFLLLGNRSK